jgi:hypothetical protein
MTKLIRSGFYQNHVQELSGYTLSELEKEYEAGIVYPLLIIFKRKKSPPRKADFQALISEARLFSIWLFKLSEEGESMMQTILSNSIGMVLIILIINII